MGEVLEAKFPETAAQERAWKEPWRVPPYVSADLHQRFRAFCEAQGVSMNRTALINIKTVMDRFGG